MTNGVVCFAVMLFSCSAVELAGSSLTVLELIMTSSVPAFLCVCVEREGTRGGAREFFGVRVKAWRCDRETELRKRYRNDIKKYHNKMEREVVSIHPHNNTLV